MEYPPRTNEDRPFSVTEGALGLAQKVHLIT